MKRLVFGLILSQFLLCFSGCSTDDTPRVRKGLVEGAAWFMGPIEGAPVRVHLSDATGADRGVVAEGLTEPGGLFYFDDLEEGHYLIRVDLSGRPWQSTRTEGAFAEGDTLETFTGFIEPAAREVERRERFVSVTPFTTLLLAVAEARRATNLDDPLTSTLLEGKTWLGFDATRTAIGARDAAVDDTVRYTLLLDSFDALANHLSALVGIQQGTSFNPPNLLNILLEDARGLAPAGRLDGEGIDGPLFIEGARRVAVTEAFLQGELLAALDALMAEEGGIWSRLEGRDVSDLRTRLACSASKLFPECKSGRIDSTPPELVRIEPEPGSEELSGERLITVTWNDPETAVEDVALERLDAPFGEVVERYSLQGREGEAFVFRIDTRAVLGESTLYLQTRATNSAGLTSADLPLQYEVRNLGAGILSGFVFKGPAHNVEVTVEGQVGSRWTELGRARTNERGFFQLALTEYQGPIRATARGLEDGMGSFFEDEARLERVRWGSSHTLVAILPFYDPTLQQLITLSPFSDMAVALAEAKSQTTNRGVLEIYPEVIRALGDHLGFEDHDNLLLAQPVDPTADSNGLSDAVRFTIGLSCFAEQAQGLGCEVLDCGEEDIGEAFTALHLVEAYRADAADGFIDGKQGGTQVMVGAAEQSGLFANDPLRNHFAHACSRWLADRRRNGLGISLNVYAAALQHMSTNVDPVLFAESQVPEPFDQRGPTITMTVLPRDRGQRVFGSRAPVEGSDGPRVVIGGPARLVIEASDDAGVATTGDEGPAWIEVTLLGGLPREALTFIPMPAELGIQRVRTVEATLDPTLLPAELEGQTVTIEVKAQDLLATTTTTRFIVQIDRQAPTIELSPPEGFGAIEGAWHTRHQGEEPTFHARFRDTTPMQASLAFRVEDNGANDEQLLTDLGDELNDTTRLVTSVDHPRILRIGRRPEGRYQLFALAIDHFGRMTRRTINVYVDRTPPTVERLANSYRDERGATTICNGDACRIVLGEQRIELGPDAQNPIDFNKIQTRLDLLDDNLPTLRYRVEDAVSPHASLQLAFAHRPDQPLPNPTPEAPDLRELRLSAATVGVPNPLVDVPDAGTLWPAEGERTLVLRDLAGNETRVESPTFALNILPPPLVFTPEAAPLPAGVDDLAALDLAGLTAATQGGRALRLGYWRVHNPWPVPVSYYVPEPDPLTVRAEGQVEPEFEADILGERSEDFPIDPFGNEYRIVGGCLLREVLGPGGRRLEPDPTQESVARVMVDAATRTITLSPVQCRARQYRGTMVDERAPRWLIGVQGPGRFERRTVTWRTLAPRASDVLEARLLSLSPETAALLTGAHEGRLATSLLDPVSVLFWNDPPLLCGGVNPPLGCRPGWWFTRRVLPLGVVRFGRPAVVVEQAALCDAQTCGRRAATPITGLPAAVPAAAR